MATFTYKGTTADGAPVEEVFEATDRYLVYDHARTLGHTITTIEERRQFSLKRSINFERLTLLLSRVKQDEVVMLSRNLGAMTRAGLVLTRALGVCERQTKNPSLKRILGSVREEVQKGKSFHESLALHPRAFSSLYIAMVRAGEEGGTLAEALETIAVQLEQSSNLRKKIRGVMIYPVVITTAMLIIGVLMMIYVVPTLTATFRDLNVALPLTTRIIIGVSDFLSAYTILALLLMAATVVGLVLLYRTQFGRVSVEWTLLRLPIIGTLVKETNAARTARTLSSLLRAGVDVVRAIEITREVIQNTFYKRVLTEAAEHVEKGKPMSEDFMKNERLYPAFVGEMVAVGEETGQIAQMLSETATFFEAEVERKTKDLSMFIEPVLMLTIGTVVGFFALAMISPIYSISDSVG